MTIENYHVANMQRPIPHNIDYCSVSEILTMRNICPDHASILTLKPGFFPVDEGGFIIQRALEGLITSVGMEVICTSEVSLGGEDALALYSDMFREEENIPAWFAELRTDLLGYITSGPIFSYLVFTEHPDISKRVRLIKNLLRQKYKNPECDRDVRNCIHVPEAGDFEKDLKILFRKPPKQCLKT